MTGAGEQAFSAGGDLSAAPMSPPEIDRPRIVEPLDRFAKPIIAAINGLAYGGGLEIALACDIRIAATTARFALPEVKIGSMAGSGGTQRLAAVVGPTLAARMILTGRADRRRTRARGRAGVRTVRARQADGRRDGDSPRPLRATRRWR